MLLLIVHIVATLWSISTKMEVVSMVFAALGVIHGFGLTADILFALAFKFIFR